MKYRYSLNNDNLLIIKSPKTRKPLMANGKLGIDKDNRLIYWLNEPSNWHRVYNLPKKLVFRGSWQLNKNYDLGLILDKTKRQVQDDILVIKGNIISVDKDVLAFEVKSYDTDGLLHVRILKLSITWLTDETNRLSFIVNKKPPDILTLQGEWQVDDNQQITYAYEKIDLKRRTRISQELTFEGFWRITSGDRLTYILKRNSDSKFDFRAQMESPNINPEKGVIKYRLGIGVRKTRSTRNKVISLYGVWKFSRRLGLSFQMEYGSGRISKTEFIAVVTPTKKDELIFTLHNKIGELLGMSVIFTRRFLKALDAQTFLRLKKFVDESRVEAAVRIPF